MSFPLETSIKEIPGQFSRFLIITDRESLSFLKKERTPAFKFPKSSKVLISIGEGIGPTSPILQYIKPSKSGNNYRFTEKRDEKAIRNDLKERFLKLKGELKKKFTDVRDLDHILDVVLVDIKSDTVLHDKFINLKKKQSLVALSRLISLKVLQETFKDLNETDKLNFKKEMLRETRFD